MRMFLLTAVLGLLLAAQGAWAAPKSMQEFREAKAALRVNILGNDIYRMPDAETELAEQYDKLQAQEAKAEEDDELSDELLAGWERYYHALRAAFELDRWLQERK
jgi:hypothetical protein